MRVHIKTDASSKIHAKIALRNTVGIELRDAHTVIERGYYDAADETRANEIAKALMAAGADVLVTKP